MKPYLFLHVVLLVLDFYSNFCSSSQNHYVGCLKSTLLFDTIALQLGCRIFFGSAVHVDLFFKHPLSVDYLPKLRVLHSHTDIKSQNALQSSIMSTYM